MILTSCTLLVMAVTAPSQGDPLEVAIRARIAQLPGATVAVAYRHLGRPDSLFIGADTSYHAASTMKVPVMIELYRKVDAGAMRLTDSVPLTNEFRSIVDGSTYKLGPDDDSDSSLYAKVGGKVTVGELIDRMITRSSNLVPAGLPPGTPVAHKTGWITATAHDAAIVYPAGGEPYVLVVLTGGIPDHDDANALIADVARLVHAHAVHEP